MCPRCNKTKYNTFNVSRYGHKLPINKCVVCSFLWIKDEDMVGLAEYDVKRLFIKEILSIGKDKT